MRKAGMEQFAEPVDRVVSIEAFEAFGKPRYSAFFKTVERILPAGGRMLLETIFTHPPSYWRPTRRRFLQASMCAGAGAS